MWRTIAIALTDGSWAAMAFLHELSVSVFQGKESWQIRAVSESLFPANHPRLLRETEQRVDTWNTQQVSSSRILDRRE